MIIRSQDKRKIETFKRTDVDYGCRTVFVNGLPFGEYSTEEKAIKVLDMICNRYQAIWDVENGCICGGGINFSSVFQMPQDSEV